MRVRIDTSALARGTDAGPDGRVSVGAFVLRPGLWGAELFGAVAEWLGYQRGRSLTEAELDRLDLEWGAAEGPEWDGLLDFEMED